MSVASFMKCIHNLDSSHQRDEAVKTGLHNVPSLTVEGIPPLIRVMRNLHNFGKYAELSFFSGCFNLLRDTNTVLQASLER